MRPPKTSRVQDVNYGHQERDRNAQSDRNPYARTAQCCEVTANDTSKHGVERCDHRGRGREAHGKVRRPLRQPVRKWLPVELWLVTRHKKLR
jgi:hypothetical protein